MNNLYKKQTENVKDLLGELESNKKIITSQKNQNEDLKKKISKLIEDDINKSILNFTIDENKKLYKKIEIQKERCIKYGYKYQSELKNLEGLKNENKKLKEKISNLEKNDRIAESVQWGEDFPEEGWETSSELECSFSEDLFSENVNQILFENKSKNVSVVTLDKSDSSENVTAQPNNSISGRKKK